MKKEVRSTIYLEEDLYNRFRQACNKKFGDKQGKIKQGYVLAISNFANDVLQDVDISAKKLNQAETVTLTEEPEIPKEQTEVVETPQEVVEVEQPRIKTPQEVIEESRSTVDTPPISATKLEPDQVNTKMVSVDKGLQSLVTELQNKEAIASVKLDQDSELQTMSDPIIKSPEQIEKERLDKVREDQRLSKIETTSQFVGENSPEAKAKRNLERQRKSQELQT